MYLQNECAHVGLSVHAPSGSWETAMSSWFVSIAKQSGCFVASERRSALMIIGLARTAHSEYCARYSGSVMPPSCRPPALAPPSPKLQTVSMSPSAQVPGPENSGLVSATIASTSVRKPPGDGGTAGFLDPLGKRLHEPCEVPGTYGQAGQVAVGPQWRKSCQCSSYLSPYYPRLGVTRRQQGNTRAAGIGELLWSYQKSNRFVYSVRMEFAVALRCCAVQLSGAE